MGTVLAGSLPRPACALCRHGRTPVVSHTLRRDTHGQLSLKRTGILTFLTRLLLLLGFLMLPGTAEAQTAPPSSALPAPGVSAPSSVTPAQAADALQILQDEGRRAQLIGVLQTIARAAPASASAGTGTPLPAAVAKTSAAGSPDSPPTSTATAASVTGSPAAAPSSQVGTAHATTATAASAALPLAPNSLGVQLLTEGSQTIRELSQDLAATARTVTSFPLLWHWLVLTVRDPDARQQVLDASWKLLLVFGCALIVEQLLVRLLRRPLRALRPSGRVEVPSMRPASPSPSTLPAAKAGSGTVPDALPPGALPAEGGAAAAEPLSSAGRRAQLERTWRLLRRLPLVAAALLLELLPVAAFALVGNLLLGSDLGQPMTSRLIILTIVNAHVLCRIVMSVVRMLFAPTSPAVRLVPVADTTAAYIEIWVRRLTVGAVFGTAIAEVALLLGLYNSAHETLLKLVALVIHLFAVVIILQCREPVAAWLRADPASHSPLAPIRNYLARVWHFFAITAVVGLWIVWAVQIENGFARLLHFMLATAIVTILARVVSIAAYGSLDRLFQISPELAVRFPGLEKRANRYYPLLRRLLSLLIFVVSILALLQVWGVNALVWFEGDAIGGRLLSALTTIVVSILVAISVWEGVNAGMERQLVRLTQESKTVQAARLRTLEPMIRSVLLMVVAAVVGLTALSEIGVNIGPLLAGASIIGVALGFGSQKLVQDLINGIFLLLENAMQVGDWVTVSGLSGSVEDLSIRTIRLRAGDGSVHIIPFSSVTSVTQYQSWNRQCLDQRQCRLRGGHGPG